MKDPEQQAKKEPPEAIINTQTDRQMLQVVLRALRTLTCHAADCEGSHINRVDEWDTCVKCWLEHDVRQHLKGLDPSS